MKRTVILYGFALAILTALLEILEYRYYLRDLSVEFYTGIVAVLFTALGVWVGYQLTRGSTGITTKSSSQWKVNQEKLSTLKISSREFEVLRLIAQGHSNQEIADELYISLNTVKTHSSKLFAKLEVRRRTQAVQRAKELGIIE